MDDSDLIALRDESRYGRSALLDNIGLVEQRAAYLNDELQFSAPAYRATGATPQYSGVA